MLTETQTISIRFPFLWFAILTLWIGFYLGYRCGVKVEKGRKKKKVAK